MPPSNRKIQRTERRLLELAPALAEFCNRDPLGDLHHRLAHLGHHAADGAARLVWTRALLVKPLAHATHRRQRALDMANHCGQRDLFRLAREAIATGNAALASHHARAFEVVENLLQKPLRDVLLLRDSLD